MKVDEFDFRVHGLLVGTRFALIKMGEQSRGEKQSERGEIILEEL